MDTKILLENGTIAMIAENIVTAKKRLCFEITKFVRGEEDALTAQKMSENLCLKP